MARLLNTQEIVEKNIDRYNETAIEDYSQFFEGTPTFVTYYSRDLLKSTVMDTLEDVNEIVGDESPFTYHKIENFTVYGLDGFNPTLNKGDFGYNTELTGEVTILPNTIRPLPNDYFTIEYSEEKFLFEITNVDSDRLKGKTFYKAEFKLSNKTEEGIEDQTNEETFTQVYDNLGTKENSIIHTKAFEISEYINGIIVELVKDYNIKYYNKQFDIHEFLFNDKKLYNQCGAYFCQQHNLFKLDRFNVFQSKHIRDILRRDKTADLIYANTLYKALEKRVIDGKQLSADCIKLSQIVESYSVFHYTYEVYSNIAFVDSSQESAEQTNNFIYHVFDSSFKNNIINNTLYEDENMFLLENIIIKYLNNTINSYEQITEILDKLNDYMYIYDIRNYLMIPMIIFILKELKTDVDTRKFICK